MSHVAMFTWQVVKKTFQEFLRNDSFTYASSIAYYTIFSLPAILIISLSIGSAFYEHSLVQQQLVQEAGKLIGVESAREIEKMVIHANYDTSGKLARVIGIITLAVSATSVFLSLQSSLNNMWGIKPKPVKGLIRFITNRLLSLAMVISLGFLLLVSLVIDTVLAFFQQRLIILMKGLALQLISGVNVMISLMLATVIFGLIFKVLPDARIKWRDVWVGALVTTILFTVGKFLIGFYLGNSSFNSAYGAAGSLVLILVWIYYSTVIMLYGAQLTSVYAAESGRAIEPDRHAVRMKIVEIEN